jgi:hypothetical protein
MLCFTMNRMYQFYAFVPLLTFWFIITYILMMVYPRVSAKTAVGNNSHSFSLYFVSTQKKLCRNNININICQDNPYHYFYMIVKLGMLIGLITTLNLSEVLFERIFIARPWKFLFVSGDELITEWRVRWSHDCYSFVFGMCFALIFAILKRLNLIEDIENVFTFQPPPPALNTTNTITTASSASSPITSPNGIMAQGNNDHESVSSSLAISGSTGDNTVIMEPMEFSDNRRKGKSILNIKIKFVMVFVAMCGLVSYFLFAVLCLSREACDNLTPYLNIIPVSFFRIIPFRLL